MHHPRRALTALIALPLLLSASLTSCSLASEDTPSSDSPPASGSSAKVSEITLVTHDSWNPPKGSIEAFEKKTGYTVKVLKSGDAGAMTNKLVLTKDSPIGDAVYGIDNTFASRAVKNDVLEEYQVAEAPKGVADHAATGDGAKYLTPVDFGDVCINVDDAWFAKKGLNPPKTLDDLKDAKYKNLLAVPGAATSSPGLSFMLASIGKYGQDGWQQYWKDLMANGAKVTKGWEEAYNTEFTAGSSGKGTRPVVVSYSSSPPFTVPEGKDEPTTSAALDTCFRQTEYAGVLKGAKNSEGAKELVAFLVSKEFQDGMADTMYMYPVNAEATLPELWTKHAPLAQKPFEVSSDDIDTHREEWLRSWTEIAAK